MKTSAPRGSTTGGGGRGATPGAATDKPDDVDLELPALDGEDDGADTEAGFDVPDLADDGGDPFDDATGEGAPIDEELSVDGTETGWLVDAESAHTLDLGAFDVVIRPDDAAGTSLLDDEDPAAGEGGVAAFDDLAADEDRAVVDAGEEGPLDADEELREEDLPALDADEDGDVPEEELYDRALFVADEDLRWDDRAWARVTASEAGDPAPASVGSLRPEESDDSGLLAVPGEDPAHTARDATWKRLEESSRSMAATLLPGGSVVLALGVPDGTRALIVRVQPDGEARIIAEIDPHGTRSEAAGRGVSDDESEDCVVTFLRWDAARGCLFVGGNFGVEAYRPAA